MRATKRLAATAVLLIVSVTALWASVIKFSGGYTKVSLAQGNRTVSLTKKARVETEDFKLEADSILLHGSDYSCLDCNGNVKVTQEKRSLTLKSSALFYDRSRKLMRTEGWTEIEDLKNEARITCARMEYGTETEVMKLEIQARIEKNTSRGLMTCSADTISFDNKAQTLVMKGSSFVEWDGDTYSAAIITVDLETEEITMSGTVNGEING